MALSKFSTSFVLIAGLRKTRKLDIKNIKEDQVIVEGKKDDKVAGEGSIKPKEELKKES